MSGRGTKKETLQEAFDEGFEAVKAYIDRELNEFEKRIETLESRVAIISGFMSQGEE